MNQTPLAILVNSDDPFNAKTAVGVLRYSPDPIVALVDPERAGQTAADVYGIRPDVPIVARVADLPANARRLLVGIASRGGDLPDEMRSEVVAAIERGMDVYNGLHTFLTQDPELSAAARARGVRLVDLREVPEHPPVGLGLPHRPGSTVVLTVGSDCNVGKMSVALELDLLSRERGLSSTFIATGQTGIMISGGGIAVDRVISDFVNGAIEELVVPAAEQYDWVWVEGQGSLFHPGYSCVTMGLLHGTAPEKMVLCHQPSRACIRRYTVPIPPLKTVRRGYEEAASWRAPSKVVAVALNTYDLDEAAAKDAIARVEDELGLPATDVVRFGAARLLDAVVG
ncbi:MAG: DUF1611 domain-containing protein [Chloroflexi bacterium]|nr:DUF1611 domain-containing protein [Chloroflexota bacterium]